MRNLRAADEAGFTLIELMIVVTIIGVLAAVAVPRFITYVRSSEAAEVSQIGGQIVTAINAYADGQNLTPAAAQTLFNNTAIVAGTDTLPTGTTSLAAIIPALNVPPDAKFNYSVTAIVATAGTQNGNTVYCLQAIGRTTAGVPNGIVAYSSSPAVAGNSGWEGRINKAAYLTGNAGTTGLTAGGYCTAAAVASATQG
ncbi:type II secretion system protein [Zavarzinia sp. CC-PAN008]|uniref:type II secretion system protein n=1 Tax=Zavarzinia sp. CC-PAN008 TaxID=3243332 RepID=UPI003F745384